MPLCVPVKTRGDEVLITLPYFLRWHLLLSPGLTDWLDWLPSEPKGSSAFCPSTLELQTTPNFLTGALGIWTQAPLLCTASTFIYWSIPQPRRWWWWKISKLVSKAFKITFQLPLDSGSGAAEMAQPDAWLTLCHIWWQQRTAPTVVLCRPSECHGVTHTQDGLFLQFQTIG